MVEMSGSNSHHRIYMCHVTKNTNILSTKKQAKEACLTFLFWRCVAPLFYICVKCVVLAFIVMLDSITSGSRENYVASGSEDCKVWLL